MDGKWGAFARARLKMCSSELMSVGSVAKQHEWCMRRCKYRGKFAEMRRPRQIHPRNICADSFVLSVCKLITGSHRHDDASGYVPKACAAADKCVPNWSSQTQQPSQQPSATRAIHLTADRLMRGTRNNARLRQFESGNAQLCREP